MIFENNTAYINQVFAENLDEEIDVLNDFRDILTKKDFYISFNGDAFDVPYLNAKYKQHKLDFIIEKSANIDLLKVSRKVYSELKNYKLKTIEEILGIHRDDLISGKDSVDMYFEFLKTKSNSLLDTILLHNFDDIKNLIHMCKLLGGMGDDDKNLFIPTYLMFEDVKYLITDFSLKDDFLSANMCTPEILVSKSIFFDSGGHFICNPSSEKTYIDINLPLISGTLNTHSVKFVNTSILKVNLNELDINAKLKYLVSANGSIIKSNLVHIIIEIISSIH